MSSLSSAGASVNGGGSIEGVSVAAGIEKAALVGVAGLGLTALPEPDPVSSPSDSAFAAPEAKPEEAVGEDQGTQSEVSVVCRIMTRADVGLHLSRARRVRLLPSTTADDSLVAQ